MSRSINRKGTKAKQQANKKAAKQAALVTNATDEQAGVTRAKLPVKPGYVALDCTSVSGGVHHKRTPTVTDRDGVAETANWSTERHVDHAQIVKDSDALVKKVDYLLRVHGTRTGFGWYVDEAGVTKLKNGMAELRIEADALNVSARNNGSQRRTHVAMIFCKLDVANEAVAQEVYRVVAENLQAIYDCLRAGTVGQDLDTAMVRAKNMGNVASGILKTAMDDAMGKVPAWRADVRVALKDGIKPADAGAKLNLDAMEAAIQLLKPWNLGI